MINHKIKETLTNLFDKHRLLFWYDADGALRDDFDALEFDDIQKLVIDGNEFGIKYQVLKLFPNQKFLIYAPYAQPKDEENWLYGLLLSHYIFSADKTSMTLSELGLDVNCKTFISKYDKFFNSAKRTLSLKQILKSDDRQSDISLKLMAVALNCDADFEEILLKVLSDDKWYEALEKLALNDDFWQHVKQRFYYESDTLHIDDLLFKLLENHFYYYVDRVKAPLNNEARLFVKNWMDSNRYRGTYIVAEKKVSETLGVKERLLEYDYKNLISCDTYEKCEQVLLSQILNQLKSDTLNIAEVLQLIENREHTFWYTALKYAAKLIASIKEDDFKILDFGDGIQSYKNNLIFKKVLDNSSEEPVYKKIDVKLSLSFFNDFDDDF